MSVERTYLDHNATAPLRPEARAAMLAALDLPGNPSSVHAEGRRARAMIETAREQVAALAGVPAAEIFFTSGGTEANNWALRAGWDTIMLSALEHDSVLAAARATGARLVDVAVRGDGVIDAGAIAAAVRKPKADAGLALIALQAANNETGVLQPVADVAAFAHAHDVPVFCDAIQAAGRVPLEAIARDVDFMSLSAHKLGGPKGVGALIVRGDTRLGALIHGGGQERRMRAGTENVAGIAGFGAAAEAARRDLARMTEIAVLRDGLEREVVRLTPSVAIIGAGAPRLPNTSCLALAGAASETLVIALDLAGVAVSAGAACSSGKVARSHVLDAMGLSEDLARAAVRISLGWSTTAADIDRFLAVWPHVAARRPERNRAA